MGRGGAPGVGDCSTASYSTVNSRGQDARLLDLLLLTAINSELEGICRAETLSRESRRAVVAHIDKSTSPPEMGGFGMSDILFNASLDLDARERRLVHREPLTPDAQFVELRRVLEHQGDKHGGSKQYKEDASRVQDFGALGLDVIQTSDNDFESAYTYDAFLCRLVSWIECDCGRRVAQPLWDILQDPECTGTRHDVFDVLNNAKKDHWKTKTQKKKERRKRRALRVR